MDGGATAAVDGDMGNVEGELGGSLVGTAREKEGSAAGKGGDGAVDGESRRQGCRQ